MSKQVKTLEDMDEQELRDAMNEMAVAVRDAMPPGTGFIVLASTFSALGGRLGQYVSNIRIDDAMNVMREFLKRREDPSAIVERIPESPTSVLLQVNDMLVSLAISQRTPPQMKLAAAAAMETLEHFATADTSKPRDLTVTTKLGDTVTVIDAETGFVSHRLTRGR